MSGYIGDPDAEATHANILNENALEAHRLAMRGVVRTHCLDDECGVTIPQARRDAALGAGMKCLYCIDCQIKHEFAPDRRPRIKMLDRIL